MTEIDTSLEAFQRHTAKARSAGTAQKYAMACRFFLKALDEWEIQNLEHIPVNVLTRYVGKLVEEGYASRTVNTYTSAAKRYMRFCRELGVPVVVPHPPDLPRITHKLGAILPIEMLARYSALACELLQEPNASAVALMPWVGLRGAELVSLPLAALSRARVTLRGGLVRDSFVLRVTGKGGDERIVPVLEEGRAILMEYLAGWRRWQRGPWLFPRPPTGREHIRDRTIRLALSKLCDPLGMDFSPHTMRRTYLVRLWRRGVDATVIAKIAGHKSIQTTFKHYLALDEDDILKNIHGEQRGA